MYKLIAVVLLSFFLSAYAPGGRARNITPPAQQQQVEEHRLSFARAVLPVHVVVFISK